MIKTALNNPHLVIVLALAAIVVGIVCYTMLPADLLPIFETSAVQIVTFYPGMPPVVMERDIMSRLQRWTGQSVGISHQEAKAMLGVCIVKDFFREGISMDTAMSQVTSYAMSDMFYLPPGTIPPMVMPFDPTASVPLCLVSVSSPTLNEKELYDVAYYELRNRLQSIQGVIAPAVYGGKLRRILAYIDREKLEARGLALLDVVKALKDQNVFIPAGNMKAGDLDYQIFANNMPKKVEELNDIPITVKDGATVYLRDVARARDSSQIQSNIVRINGRRQVYIPIYRQPGANTIQIVDSIKRNLSRILKRLREMDQKNRTLALEVVLDQSVYVRDTVRGLMIAGGLGAFLAALIVLIFLRNLRSTLIIMLSIPLAVLVAFIGLFYSGNTINAMTLGGLALAIGILVDQSIVVLENIVRHVRMGKQPAAAAYDGAKEVALPILVSTITFIVVFYPIVFLSGMARFLFTPLGLAATFAILASYVIAITLIPAYAARFLKAETTPTDPEASVVPQTTSGEGPRRSGFGSLVEAAISSRWLVVLGCFGLLAGGGFLFTQTGTELFPQVDANQFQIFVRLPTGTRIETTEATLEQIEEVIMARMGRPDPEYPKVEQHADSDLRMLITNIGVLMDWPAAYTPNTGPMDAFVLAQLKGKRGSKGTFEYVQELREDLQQQFPSVEFSFDTGGLLTAALNQGEPAPIHLQVSGSKLEIAMEIAEIVLEDVKGVPGTTDVRIAQRLDYPILKFDIDRKKAALAGINVDDIMKSLVTATNSSINFDPAFWIDERNGNHYFIGAQYAESDLTSIDSLLDIPIRPSTNVELNARTSASSNGNSNGDGDHGQAIPLRTFVTVKREKGPAVVNHKNITRVIDVYATVAPGRDLGSVVSEIESRLAANGALKLVAKTSDRGDYYDIRGPAFADKGYSLTMTGEIEIMRNSFGQFAFGLAIAVLLIYLVMVAQFRSFLDPFVILLTVPLGLVGVSLVLYLTGTALNIQSFMGIIMMTGIVVEYSIVLIDFANGRLREGASVREAVIDATTVRLRPILMTSLTTLLAIAPMAFGFGGGDANVPLARAIIGGVLGASALTLFVVPCLYVLFKRAPEAAAPQPARG